MKAADALADLHTTLPDTFCMLLSVFKDGMGQMCYRVVISYILCKITTTLFIISLFYQKYIAKVSEAVTVLPTSNQV